MLQSAVQQLCTQYMSQPVIREKESKQQESRYSWWNWRRNRTSREATPALETPQTEIVKCVEVKEVMVMETLEQTLQQDILSEEGKLCLILFNISSQVLVWERELELNNYGKKVRLYLFKILRKQLHCAEL